MRIITGVEDIDGCFVCKPCNRALPGETPIEALKRVATEWYSREKFKGMKLKKQRIVEKYDIIGPKDNPTAYLPALFVGKRIFCFMARWDQVNRSWYVVK